MFDCRQIYASNHRRRLDTPGIPGGEGAPQMVNPGMAPIGQCLGLDMLQHGWETFCVHAQFFIPVVKNFFFSLLVGSLGFRPNRVCEFRRSNSYRTTVHCVLLFGFWFTSCLFPHVCEQLVRTFENVEGTKCSQNIQFLSAFCQVSNFCQGLALHSTGALSGTTGPQRQTVFYFSVQHKFSVPTLIRTEFWKSGKAVEFF